VFALVGALASKGALTVEEEAFWRTNNDWYNERYPNPALTNPEVFDRSINPRSVCWFASASTDLTERVAGYLEILDSHGVECERVESKAPGRILYEDADQIVVAVDLPNPHKV
jgi:hypothetical protein